MNNIRLSETNVPTQPTVPPIPSIKETEINNNSDLISKSELLKEFNNFCGNQKDLIPKQIWEIVESAPSYQEEKLSQKEENKKITQVQIHLLKCFPKGRFLPVNPIEFLAHPKGNIYFILGNCQSKLDIDCKVLEWFSRAAYKTEPYETKYSNKAFHEYFLHGINQYFGSNFTEKDIETIYTYLGNACDHQKTIDFIESNFDMSVLDPSLNKVCIEEEYGV